VLVVDGLALELLDGGEHSVLGRPELLNQQESLRGLETSELCLLARRLEVL